MNQIDQLLEVSVVHETMPVPIDRRLARAGWVALVALAVSVPLHANLIAHGTEPGDAGLLMRPMVWAATVDGHSRWLFLAGCAALAVGAVLLISTGGFHRANRVEHWALAALSTAGPAVAAPFAAAVIVGMLTMVLVIFFGLVAMFCAAIVLGGAMRR